MFTEEEKQIILHGKTNGKTKEETLEALKRYRYNAPITQAPERQSGFSEFAGDVRETGTALANTFTQGADRFGQIDQLDQSTGRSLFRKFGTGAGTAARAIGDVVIGAGKALLPQSAEDAVAAGAEKALSPIVNNENVQRLMQRFAELEKQDPGLAADLRAVGGIGELATTLLGGTGARATLDAGVTVAQRSSQALSGITNKGMQGIQQATQAQLAPQNIMQRVARVSKGKQAAFEKRAGESIGDYLVKRGIFGDIDELTEQLYKRFDASKGTVDAELGKLPGTYKPTPVGSALRELAQREQRVSTPGAPSRDLEKVRDLFRRYNGAGLTMSEINDVKRLYERNVRLDFVKSNVPTDVARANNVDSAIREWQRTTASQLGFKNIDELNRETMLAKQLLDDLGAEYSGSAGNNAVTLTDWIILSGGDPTAVGGFLAKKTLSSRGIMSSIAKRLAPDATVGTPTAKIEKPTIDNYLNFLKSTEGRATQSAPQTPQTQLPKASPDDTTSASFNQGAIPTQLKDTGDSTGAAAFGVAAAVQPDEEGNLTLNPLHEALGVFGAGVASKVLPISKIQKEIARNLSNNQIVALNEVYRRAASNIDDATAVTSKHAPLMRELRLTQDVLDPFALVQRIRSFIKEIGEKRWRAAVETDMSEDPTRKLKVIPE